MTSARRRSDLGVALEEYLRPGMTVALGDGVGTPCHLDDGVDLVEVLCSVAAAVGGIRLIVGWQPKPLEHLDPSVFDEVIALMPGWGVRSLLEHPNARFLPTRLAAVPALLAGPIRPDILIARVVRRDGGFHFGTEVSWQREVVESGVDVLGVSQSNGTAASAEDSIPDSAITVVADIDSGPVVVPERSPEQIHEAIADRVLGIIPSGARLQYGPGQLGTAILQRTEVPLRIDTGLLTDAVVDLDERGLLVGTPSATYLLGGRKLYEWSDGKAILHGIDHTHDLSRLATGGCFVAVNTAIEIDRWGQVNVEGVGDSVFGGIGGHPDYCAAGRMSRDGLSIIAVPHRFRGRSPFVETLSRPASTPAFDIDIVVTERGHADLREAAWDERTTLLQKLFED